MEHKELLKNMDYADYLKTDHWQNMRKEKYESVGESCQICNSTHHLDVHHKTYERLGEELLLDLTVLCHPCHELFHEKINLSKLKANLDKILHHAQGLIEVLSTMRGSI